MPRVRMRDPVSRYELSAKLAAQNAKLESALQKILDAVEQIQADGKTMAARFDAKFSSVEDKFFSMKVTMIVTAIATVLTVIFGVGAINATLTSNMLAAFQAGAVLHHSPAPPAPKPVPPSSTSIGPIATAS
ncbi:hypothetical protein [Bordetella sp. N]|uniref:hypothetical protein n=1 Tax=Bordetella sp. N TaxID=1746199 RepID=UPI00070A57BC|nr:hypothetical protein [Bordetella sp. N]ALM86617.1 hypothetical protein ASB57_30110 [Bordetella sp. N]